MLLRVGCGSTGLPARPGLQSESNFRFHCYRNPKEGRLRGIADAGGVDVGIEIGLEIMVRRHLMPFAAFFMQSHPPSLALESPTRLLYYKE